MCQRISVGTLLLKKVDDVCPLGDLGIVQDGMSLVVAGIDVSTGLDQLSGHLGLGVVVDGHDEGCLAEVVPGVDVGTGLEQDLDHLRVVGVAGRQASQVKGPTRCGS